METRGEFNPWIMSKVYQIYVPCILVLIINVYETNYSQGNLKKLNILIFSNLF